MKLPEFTDTDLAIGQFERQKIDKILLLDGDILLYKAAATVTTLGAAIRRFYTLVLTEMFLTGTNSSRVYLTPKGCLKCNRILYPTVKHYQDNRVGLNVLELRDPLKHHLLCNPNELHSQGIKVLGDSYYEADDLMIMDSYVFGDGCIVSSADKDLRQTQSPYWDAINDRVLNAEKFGYLEQLSKTSKNDTIGQGTKFLHAQMIMGDTADNVKGLISYNGKQVGAVAAYNLLKDIHDENESINFILSMYKSINQNILAEAEMLFLHRFNGDSAYNYIKSLDLDCGYDTWLDDLHTINMEALNGRTNTK